MTAKLYIQLALCLIISATMLSCSTKPVEETEEKSPETAVKAKQMELSSEQMAAVGIETGPVERKNLNTIVKASGQLAVPPQNKADVSVLSGGLLQNITVIEGQQVRKGQVLAMIENQELIRIQQDYLAAKNSFSYVQAEYDRQKQLKEAGAGTGKSYQQSEATYQAERGRISAYESQLKQLGVQLASIKNGQIISGFPLKSPISGTVGQITANIGAYVQPGTSIMEVVDNSKIHCDLIVFEKDLMKVKAGQRVDLQLTNQDNQQIAGTISGINKSFENESKGVIVHAVINNTAKQNLIPGMYVTALISVGHELLNAVPADAVIRAEGREYIFLVTGKSKKGTTFQKVEVKTGVSELGYTAIKALSPLAEHAQIANKGAFYLQSKFTGNTAEE